MKRINHTEEPKSRTTHGFSGYLGTVGMSYDLTESLGEDGKPLVTEGGLPVREAVLGIPGLPGMGLSAELHSGQINETKEIKVWGDN